MHKCRDPGKLFNPRRVKRWQARTAFTELRQYDAAMSEGSGTLSLIRSEWSVNSTRGKIVLVLFRLSSSQSIPRLPRALIAEFYKVLVSWIFGIEIPSGTDIGPGLQLHHATGLVVNRHAVLGAGCVLRHGCTIGNKEPGAPAPVLGDCVSLGAASHVIGAVRLGDRVEVGVGAVVLQDVPSDHIAVGNPARILPKVRSVNQEHPS